MSYEVYVAASSRKSFPSGEIDNPDGTNPLAACEPSFKTFSHKSFLLIANDKAFLTFKLAKSAFSKFG